jgi:AhpD family alkylhydroperoxidase
MLEPHLDPKTELLVALGSAVAAKCQVCFVGLYAQAGKVGTTDQEVRAVVAIANKVAAKSQEFMNALVKDTTKGPVADGPDEPGWDGCACA